jgi:uncharacterized protein
VRHDGWRGRIADMLEAIDRIAEFTTDLDATTFARDPMARDAVIWNLTVIGGAARAIPTSVEAQHADIPWAKMRGLRNLLVHEYFGIDDQIIWVTVVENVLPLAQQLRRLLDAGEDTT